MAKCYRFRWNHQKKYFERPENFELLDSDEQKKAVLEIIETIQKNSGLVASVTWKAVAYLLITYAVCASICGYLIWVGSPWGSRLLMATPFISFIAVGYLLTRKSMLDRITNYLRNNLELLGLLAKQQQLVIAYYFYKVSNPSFDNANSSSNLRIDTDMREIKQKPKIQCCIAEVLEGYIEFENIRTGPIRPRNQKQGLVRDVGWSLQNPQTLNPEPPKKASLKPAKINLATRPVSPPKKQRTKKK